MHTYVRFDQNIPCGTRITIIFTNCKQIDRQTHTMIKVQTCGRAIRLRFETKAFNFNSFSANSSAFSWYISFIIIGVNP